MSLYTVAENCHSLLLLFILPNSAFMTPKNVHTHIKLGEKYLFDLSSLKEELFPLAAISTRLLEKHSAFVIRPKDELENEIYAIFSKLLGLYIITNKLANQVKTEEGTHLLDIIFHELAYVKEDIQNNDNLTIDYPALKINMIGGINDCLDRMSTIITLPAIPQDNNATYFLSLALEESSLNDIANVLNNIILYLNIDFLNKIDIQSYEQWFGFFNNLYEQCSLEFYTHKLQMKTAEEAINQIQQASHLSHTIHLIYHESPYIYSILNLYIYIQYLLCQSDMTEKNSYVSSLQSLIYQTVEHFYTEKKHVFDLGNELQEAVLIKIQAYIENMNDESFEQTPLKNILELNMQDIHLNDVLDALQNLLYEYYEQIRIKSESDANEIFRLHDALFNSSIKNPLMLKEYLIPPRYHHEIVKIFKQYIIKPLQLQVHETQLLKKYPFVVELSAFYYYTFSLSIDENFVYNSLVPLLLYEEFYGLIKNKHYHSIYAHSSDYFKETMKTILYFMEGLCQHSTVNAFITRAMLLDFTIIATFAQGTREYYEAEDGLCAGYVNHIAEHFLIHQNKEAKTDSRSLRWNVKTQKSPFEFSVNSPFQQVIANSRTFDFQEKPLIQVTSAIQMEVATSQYHFSCGEELAEKLLELIAEHPNTIMRLGVWQQGVEIGHALACFVQNNMLHFFCATHSWITIPYQEADPKLHAFLKLIFQDLDFFNQYNLFWIGIIHRTWEATPVDDKHFYHRQDVVMLPSAYDRLKCDQLAQKADALINAKIIQRDVLICNLLSIAQSNS